MSLLSFAAIIALLSNVALAVPYGELCEDDATCTEANNKCLKQSDCSKGWCDCGNGYDRVDNSCVTEKLLGHSCTTYCSVGTCTGGTCQCGAGLVASSDNRRCIGKALGETCTAAAKCEGSYTFCDGTCKCLPGYKKLDSNSCSYYDNGETCTLGASVCPSQASCINTTSTSATCACNTVDGTKYEWWGDAKVCVHPGAEKNVGYGQTCIPYDYSSTGRLCAAGLVCQYCPTNSTSGDYKCFNGVGQIRASSLAIVTVLLLGIKIGLFTA